MPALQLSIALAIATGVLLLFGVLRALYRAWLSHTVHLAALAELEHAVSVDASGYDSRPEVPRPMRANSQDFTLTGALLASIGMAGIFTGRSLGIGEWAVGLYTGGIVCIGLGVALALVGVLVNAIQVESQRGPAKD